MPGHNMLYVGRHRHMTSLGYVSPYLLEILNSSVGFSSQVATGSLTANTGQTVSCSRAASAYCLGNDGLLHLLAANTVRVEPSGLLVEGASTNLQKFSTTIGDANWTAGGTPSAATITLNSTDVTDPTGANTATKVAFPAVSAAQDSYLFGPTLGFTGASNTSSFWMRTLSGTATINYTFNRSGLSYNDTINVTSTWQRFTITHIGDSSGNWFMQFENNGTVLGAQGAQTVYIWGPQNENLAFATSYIPTTSAAASRDADVVTVANPLNPSNPGTWRMGGTFTPEGTWAQVINISSGAVLMSMYDGVAGFVNQQRFNCTGPAACAFEVRDGTGTVKSVAVTLSGSTTLTLTGLDTAGAMSTVPSGSSSGTGTGIVATQQTPVYLGSGGNATTFCLYGHMTDLVVHNA